jgi:predicted DNA-binding WGR domain protein
MDKTLHFWCYRPEENKDKVYQLTLVQAKNGKYDVLSGNARRGQNINLNILKTDVDEYTAENTFNKKVKEKVRKGYKLVKDLQSISK